MDATTRSKIDAIWQGMWDNSMADAKTNITQITYLLFIKMLDDAQIKKERNANAFHTKVKDPVFKEGIYKDDVSYEDLRWHNFVHFDTEKMFVVVRDYVFSFIKEVNASENNAFSRFMSDAKLDIPSGKILERVVRGLDDDALSLDNKEIMGDVYEYLLDKLSVNGTNGQFRTPRHIIRMMVQLMQPKLGEKICDPAMGSAGFLMESAKYILEHQKEETQNDKENRKVFNSEMFYGNETDPDMLRIGTMNMTLHEVSDPQIVYKNSLTDDNTDTSKYDLVLANPPFSGSFDANDLAKSIRDIVSTKSTELLFVALFLRSLKIGGRCASIVPVGVVNNTNEKAYTILRKELVENQKLRAIIYMPIGVFKPYAGVQTAIIIFDKTNNGGTDKVWLYNMENDGYSLDDKRNKIDENDIPDIIEKWNNLDKENVNNRYDKSFFITKEDIVSNDYVLRWNKYHKDQIVKKDYRNSDDIISAIRDEEKKFNDLLMQIIGDKND
ncbi:MAG: class I SAM-dependent DNA methyltransferase [Candidatus Izemoplasmatales bacterium]|nr:class I SAM-dependent DNA methyltransferase [Candidatus Izemoplasmatales bacterium]